MYVRLQLSYRDTARRSMSCEIRIGSRSLEIASLSRADTSPVRDCTVYEIYLCDATFQHPSPI